MSLIENITRARGDRSKFTTYKFLFVLCLQLCICGDAAEDNRLAHTPTKKDKENENKHPDDSDEKYCDETKDGKSVCAEDYCGKEKNKASNYCWNHSDEICEEDEKENEKYCD